MSLKRQQISKLIKNDIPGINDESLNEITSLLDDLKDITKLCINLMYLNRCSIIGKFALSYKDKFNKYFERKNYKKIKELFDNPKCVEFDDNEFLNDKFISIKNKYINDQLTIYYLLFDNISYNNVISFEECEEKVCIFNSESINKPKNIFLMSEKNDFQVENCYSLPELLINILSNKLKNIKPDMKKEILSTHEFEVLLVKKYLSTK